MTNGLIALHGIAGIVAFGMLVFPGIYFDRIARTGNIPAIRSAFGIAVIRAKIGGPLALATGLFGLWIAYKAGYSLTAGWLIASYIVFVVVMAIGIAYHSRWEQKTLALAQASPDAAPSAELRAHLESGTNSLLSVVSALLWVSLFYLMIARPF